MGRRADERCGIPAPGVFGDALIAAAFGRAGAEPSLVRWGFTGQVPCPRDARGGTRLVGGGRTPVGCREAGIEAAA